MLKESQSAQHIVLDESLKDMLNMLKICDKDIQNLHISQEKHTVMINDLQTAIDNQMSIKEKHETKIQELNISFQRGEAEALSLTSEFSEYKGCIEKCTDEIEAYNKEIDKIELTIKGIQKEAMDKQNQVADFTRQLFKLEGKYDYKFKEIDEQLKTCVKEIDDMKIQHDKEVTSSKISLISVDVQLYLTIVAKYNKGHLAVLI